MKSLDMQRLQQEYRRLWLAEEDLAEVTEFVGLILDRDLHSRADEVHDPELRAFGLALVVSYARAFVDVRSPTGKRADPLLSTDVLACLSDDERRLHDHILKRRHQEFAHSDAGPVEFEIEFMNGEAISMSSVTRVPLSRAETKSLQAITQKLLREVGRRQDELRAKAPRNLRF